MSAPEDTNITTILDRRAKAAIAGGRHPMYRGAHRVGCVNTVEVIPGGGGSLPVAVTCGETRPCSKCEQEYDAAVVEANDHFQRTAYR